MFGGVCTRFSKPRVIKLPVVNMRSRRLFCCCKRQFLEAGLSFLPDIKRIYSDQYHNTAATNCMMVKQMAEHGKMGAFLSNSPLSRKASITSFIFPAPGSAHRHTSLVALLEVPLQNRNVREQGFIAAEAASSAS